MRKTLLLAILLIANLQIVFGQQPVLYGMTRYGGDNAGVIFGLSVATNSIISQNCLNMPAPGSSPKYSNLVQGINGKLYGMTRSGGSFNDGVIFEYDTITNISIKKVNFNDIINGKHPEGSLLKSSNGKFYGMTYDGGLYGFGVLFEYDPATNIFLKRVDFDGVSKGANPRNSLTEAANGKLYGVTNGGGSGGNGVIFEYDPLANIFLKKIDLTINGGYMPEGNLVLAANGKMYGLAFGGSAGIFGDGVIFEYDYTTNVYAKKIDFSSTTTGSGPYGSLIEALDGKLYGMTHGGGANNKGVIFQYDPGTNTCVKKIDFNGTARGAMPYGSLIQLPNGKFYGMTNQGGANDYGVLFEYDCISNILTKKVDFDNTLKGAQPYGSLMLSSNGCLYGMTYSGGTNHISSMYGVLFSYNPNTSVFTKKLDFGSNINGNYMEGHLLPCSDGMLYGTTEMGGIGQGGVLFQYNPFTNTYTKKKDFYSTSTGAFPYSRLLESNNKLYGVAAQGGANSKGVIFEYDYLNNIYTKKIDFNGTNGATPMGGLVKATNSKFYGITTSGGAWNNGTVFQYNPATNTCSVQLSFYNASALTNPIGSLMQASNGNLYGATTQGAANNLGGIFQINLATNTNSILVDFDGTTKGSSPTGYLIEASNGKLYGVTAQGGTNNTGVLFEYELSSGTYSKKMDFINSTDGTNPTGSLYEASNGKLYGVTVLGGAYNLGVIFEYDLTTNGYTKIWDFDELNGSYPYDLKLTESCGNLPIQVNSPVSICIGSSANIVAMGSSSYTWNTGANTASINVSPTITTVYSVTGNCTYTKTVSLAIDPTCQDVWPGDANSDGAADNIDVLELGLHYTQTGPGRATISNSWQSYFSNNWTGTITNGKNLNHSDCNGDGTINADDTLAIYTNYGLTHSFKPNQQTIINPQLSIVPDQAMVVKGTWGTASIYLGDAANPVNNINGIAYTIDFNNMLIETNSIFVQYDPSFLNAATQNLNFRKPAFNNGKIYTATTHTNNTNVSGYGKIATLHYKIKSSLSTDQVLNLGLLQANQSDENGTIIPLTSGTGTLMAIGASVGLNESVTGNLISIAPNPGNSIVLISSTTDLEKTEVINLTGQVLISENTHSKVHRLNVENLVNGVYFVKVYNSDKQVILKKLVIQK